MMKHRDLIFLAFPLSVLILVALAVGLLFHQFRAFENAYIHDAQETLRQDAHFVAQVIDGDLRAGDLPAIQRHFAFFTGKPLRFTLIAPDGNVAAESDVPLANLANHADRPEVQAIDADGDFETRYSTTMNAWLLYYAMPLHDGWVLRASLPTAALDAAIGQVRLAIILALCAGLILALALFLYLFLRVRPHFNALQASAVAIARGRLDTPIDVPRNGPLRELAKAIAVMGRQLRNRIDELRRERDDFDTLFNTLREPLLLVAPNGDILRSNRAAADLFGEAVATPGFRIERTACPELIAYVRGAFAEPTLHGREIPFDDGGTPRALLAHAVRMEREGKLCILLLLTDLTDLRRLESFRSDFVANVSHEIKTPLAATPAANTATTSSPDRPAASTTSSKTSSPSPPSSAARPPPPTTSPRSASTPSPPTPSPSSKTTPTAPASSSSRTPTPSPPSPSAATPTSSSNPSSTSSPTPSATPAPPPSPSASKPKTATPSSPSPTAAAASPPSTSPASSNASTASTKTAPAKTAAPASASPSSNTSPSSTTAPSTSAPPSAKAPHSPSASPSAEPLFLPQPQAPGPTPGPFCAPTPSPDNRETQGMGTVVRPAGPNGEVPGPLRPFVSSRPPAARPIPNKSLFISETLKGLTQNP